MDGDQISVKPLYSIEANAELEKQINSKSNYISIGGVNRRISTNECIEALYSLTLQLPDVKLGAPTFKK